MKSIKKVIIKTDGKFISDYIEMALNLVEYYPDGLRFVNPKIMTESDYRQIIDTAIGINPKSISCIHKSYPDLRNVCLDIVNENPENIKLVLDYHYNNPYSRKRKHPLYESDIEYLIGHVYEQNPDIIRSIDVTDYRECSLGAIIKLFTERLI